MWDNISGKIKSLAKFIAWFGIISSIIGGIVLFSIGGNQRYGGGIFIGIGFATIFLGSLFFWISSWFMYGFGELIENTESIRNNTSKNNNNSRSSISGDNSRTEKSITLDSTNSKKCKICGEKVHEDIFKCPNCKCESFI